MSKSLGNFFTVKDLCDRGIPGEVIRYVLLSTHYRQPLDWTEEKVEEAKTALRKWHRYAGLAGAGGEAHPGVLSALADDLNTPRAISELHQLALSGAPQDLVASARLLGLLTPHLSGWAAVPGLTEAQTGWIEFILNRRLQARQRRNFAEADRLRDALRAAGIEVKDLRGNSWEFEPTTEFDPARLDAIDPDDPELSEEAAR
jgi:cysteinyl-tRNA synthetase